jgi:SAM-dependent methyltransferase
MTDSSRAPDRDEVLAYWNREDVESMYDKHLLAREVALICARLPEGAKILDAGCGEGEGTAAYVRVPGARVHGVDFSETRLAKASERLRGVPNVELRRIDFLSDYELDRDYDAVVSQRFLINLMEWELQARVLTDLASRLRPGGLFLVLEGSAVGVAELDAFRGLFGLPPIPVKWHNLFFDDGVLVAHMKSVGCTLEEITGLGAYFLLTRGVRPNFDEDLSPESDFNRVAASGAVEDALRLGDRFSRLKLWAFRK